MTDEPPSAVGVGEMSRSQGFSLVYPASFRKESAIRGINRRYGRDRSLATKTEKGRFGVGKGSS